MTDLNEALLKVATAENIALVPVLAFPMQHSLSELETLADALPPELGQRLREQAAVFRELYSGPDGLVALRRQELAIGARASRVVTEWSQLSHQLTSAVDLLVTMAKGEIGEASTRALRDQRFSASIVGTAIILSLLSSVMVVWLYVHRSLVRRLRALSDSMLAVAGGNLRVPLPQARGSDEIADMARALTVFRDTAVEIEENNLLEIAQARQRLIDAIESISEGFAFYDAEDRLVLCNSRYRELLYDDTRLDLSPGMTFESIVRRAVELGSIPDAAGDPQGWLARRLDSHRNPGPPRLQRRSNGRWLQISERKIAGGGTVAVYSDLTELKHREQEAVESERRLQAITDNAPAVIFMKDRDGRYILTNRLFNELMRRSSAELLGRTDYDLLDAEAADHWHASDQKVLTTGQPISFEHQTVVDGEQRWSFIKKFPLINSASEIYALGAIAIDITERKRQEEELQRVTERLQLALAMDGIGVWDVDLVAGRVWWSREYTQMMGYDPDTFVPTATTWEEHLHPDQAAAVIRTVEEFLRGPGTLLRMTQHLVTGSGRDVWVEEMMRAQRDASGRAIRLSGLDVDITEQLERERQLRDANRLILDSLRYASRIQSAILPAREALATATRDYFLIWEPRDIVGGDFFWLHRTERGYFIITGDCTGHGVPGAFMTLIACGLIDRHLRTLQAPSPATVLAHLHRDLQMLLGQDQGHGETDDGLEAGICLVHPEERTLVFAGAHFSLWRARNGTVEEIRGDKAGIGYRRFPSDTTFNDLTLDLADGETFYMTTDGLVDQIGGERRRSFGRKRFEAFIAGQHGRPMPEQQTALRSLLSRYQGQEVRRDDVTVLGFVPL